MPSAIATITARVTTIPMTAHAAVVTRLFLPAERLTISVTDGAGSGPEVPVLVKWTEVLKIPECVVCDVGMDVVAEDGMDVEEVPAVLDFEELLVALLVVVVLDVEDGRSWPIVIE